MIHAIHKVDSFSIIADYTLRINFDDGTQQVIDFEPVLFGVVFGPLRNLELFNRVQVDPEVRTLVWPNGADFDPATLHDWPTNAAELAARAAKWNLSRA